LRRIVRGPADESYGIQVAKLAGIPDSVVNRAKEILQEIVEENGGIAPVARMSELPDEPDMQLTLQGAALNDLKEELSRLDVNTLTPIEAMQTLYAVVKKAQSLD
jgi:DNA mismatch repair protein MutS